MSSIGEVIGWKFNGRPGMTTRGDEIVEWPDAQLPTAAEIAAWTAEYELWRARKERKAAVEAKLLDMGENGIPYGGKLLQMRAADQQNIIAMSQAAMLAQAGAIPWPADFAWRMRDNSYLPMPTPADMIALAAFAMQTVKTLRFKAFAHKDAVDALATAAEVAAYDIDQGW